MAKLERRKCQIPLAWNAIEDDADTSLVLASTDHARPSRSWTQPQPSWVVQLLCLKTHNKTRPKFGAYFRPENRPNLGRKCQERRQMIQAPPKEWWHGVYIYSPGLQHRKRLCDDSVNVACPGPPGVIWFRHCPASIAALSLSFKPLEDTNSHGSDLRVTCCSENVR